jgi:tripartite-type tricarboxylate transporter receptor subunit TctC
MIKRSVVALVLGLIAAAPAKAQSSVADFYKGRTIDVYVGLSAGGLYDVTARLLARFMGKHIPGNPTLVARNMEGAAGLRLANWLYQVGPKDGTAIGTFARGLAFNSLLGQPGALFDATKFNWIGSTNNEVSICAAWHSSGVTKIEQVYKKELIIGSTGGGGDDEQLPKILNAVLGTKFRTVPGYPGGNEIKLAMQRGEVNGRCGWSWSSVKATEGEWLKDKKITVLIQLSLRKHPDLPDVPSIMDLVKTDEGRQIFKVIFARQVMAWPFAAAPGVPAERIAALRKAFDDTMKDEEFLAEAKRLRLEVTPVSGEKIQALIQDLYRTTSPELAKKIAAMLK